MVRSDEEYIKELDLEDFKIDDVIFFPEKLKIENFPYAANTDEHLWNL